MATEASADRGGSPGGSAICLHGHYDIWPDRPVPELDVSSARAFAVDDRRSAGVSLFAHVVEGGEPLRYRALPALRQVKSPNILAPVTYGPVLWTPSKKGAFVVVSQRPAGGRLVERDDQEMEPWSESDTIQRLLLPVASGLKSMAAENLTHRNIRPSNILFADAARRQAVLGDCVTAQPGARQPLAYETIEAAMAHVAGRGNGTAADDFYALGALLVFVLLGKPPGGGMTPDQLFETKIARGSYGALIGDRRLPTAINEMVRGLLIDDPAERWTIGEVESWLQGRRLSPKVQVPVVHATRPLEIGDEQVMTARNAARALVAVGDQAAALVRGHAFETWLQRALGDKLVIEAVASALADSNAAATGGNDARLLARVAIALDPSAPIRYRKLSMAPDGMGAVLANAMIAGHDTKMIAEIVLARLPQFWCGRQKIQRPDLVGVVRDFDRFRIELDDTRPGHGIERLVYELNPGLHCLSPFLLDRYVVTPSEMLPALEVAAAEGRIQTQPVDRHVAGFLANRIRQGQDAVLATLGHTDPAIRMLAMLQMLAQLQVEMGPASLPALTQVFGKQAPLAILRYRNRKTRERQTNHLASMVALGSLSQLLQFLHNAEERQRDATMFARAQSQFQYTVRALIRCERERADLPEEANETAGAIAAAMGVLIACGAFVASFIAVGSL